MAILFSFLPFFVAIIFSFYIPGIVLLEWAQTKLSRGEKQMMSWPIGVSLFLLGTYLSAWMHVNYAYLVILFLLLGIAIWKYRFSIFNIKLPTHIDYVALLIICFGSLSFLSLTFLSGIYSTKGFQLSGITNSTDGLMHLAYIKNLLTTFPPTHAGLAGYTLRGYHYFYDLLLSRFVLFFNFSSEDLQYRLFPLFMSLTYGCGFYLFAKTMTKEKISQWFILFFAFFAESWSPIFSIFFKSVHVANGFGVVQPLELILDPSVIFSVGIMLAIAYLFITSLQSVKTAILVGLVFGVMCELKVYTGVIIIGTICLFSMYAFFIKKKRILPYLVVLIITAVLTAITFLPNNLGSGTSLIFAPLFVYESFMQESLFSSWHWEIERVIFSDHHNIPHLILHYAWAILFYWFMALGIRSLFIFGIGKILIKHFWDNDGTIFLLLLILIPMLIGTFFVQSISIFDTKQFFWIAAVLISIPSGIIIGQVFQKFPPILKLLMLIIIVWSFLGAYVYDENVYFFHASFVIIPNSELHILRIINTEVPASGFVMNIPPRDKANKKLFHWYPAPFIAGLSGRNTYYEPEVAQYALTNVFTQRKNTVWKLSQSLSSCNASSVLKIMKEVGTKYLVTAKKYSCVALKIPMKQFHSPQLHFYEIQ